MSASVQMVTGCDTSLPMQEPQHKGNALGMADIRMYREVDVVLGCGLGGTSLINANVVMKPVKGVFSSPEWPKEVQTDIQSGPPPICIRLCICFPASKECHYFINMHIV